MTVDPITDVVLTPGYMLGRDMWTDVEGELKRLGPLSYADLSRDRTIEAMADRLLQNAPARFVLVGFSMGGYVAREAARRSPDRVIALVLIATSSRGDSDVAAQRKAVAAQASDTLKFTGLSRLAIASSFAPDNVNDTRIARVRAMGDLLGADVFLRQSTLARETDADRLAELACPTLIIARSEDRLRKPDEAEELHRGIPGSTLVIIEHAGHMIPMEQPAALSHVILGWLAAL